MDAFLTGHGEHQMADQDVCIAVGEDLTRTYPGYAWDVGADHQAGTVVVRLSMPAVGGIAQPGFLLHLSAVLGPGGQRKVLWAGGEVLERWGLPRGRAPEDWRERAQQHGLDRRNMIEKSRH